MAKLTVSKKVAKALDNQISRIFYAHCEGITIPVLDIPKIFAAGRAAAAAGTDLTAAVLAAVETVRVKA